MRYSILIFKGHEVITEQRFSAPNDTKAIDLVLRGVRPELSGVLLSNDGLIAHSANLPKDNVWYRELCLHV